MLLKPLSAAPLKGKNIILRVDFNVPVFQNQITDTTRLKAAVATTKHLLNSGVNRIILISHFGRPTPGQFESNHSLVAISAEFSKLIDQPITFIAGIIDHDVIRSANNSDSQLIMLDNLRFNPGETSNDAEFTQLLSQLGDLYINDAFACSHRSHASLSGIAALLPAYAGLQLQYELDNLKGCFNPQLQPKMAVIGGAKVSTKLKVLKSLITSYDYLAIGGAMANTFLMAQGYNVGNSLTEPDLLTDALDIIQQAQQLNCQLILPTTVVTAANMDATATNTTTIDSIALNSAIFDVGAEFVDNVINIATTCQFVLWNGPMGVSEQPQFANGTKQLGLKLGKLGKEGKIVIAGGGDSLSAINQFNISGFTFCSTGGGAFLEYLANQGRLAALK